RADVLQGPPGRYRRVRGRRGRHYRRRRRTPSSGATRSGDASELGSGILNMSSPLQQTIEALAKEKGIEPDVVISAIEEAVATASRKYYKTGENLNTVCNMDRGQVDLFALKTVVQEVAAPATEISIDEARDAYRSAGYG